MTDKVLTDDEKNALLDGVQSGEVEVHSSGGPTYASVTPFEIGPRSRIVKDSYPRLQLLNQQVADRLSKYTEQLLQCQIRVEPRGIVARSYGEFCEQLAGPSVVTIFEAPPLNGRALIVMEPAMVRHFVDTFFGGSGDAESATSSVAFTPGELSVSTLFANVILSTIKEVWASVTEISPDRIDTDVTIDVVDIVAESDQVLATEFEVSTAETDGVFRILWPEEMIKPLMPAFDGQKIDRDPSNDRMWEMAISRRVADSIVNISANVGHAQMRLGSLINLAPGDVIDIDDPQRATLMARHVPLMGGRFGVHRGQNAVEATNWLDAQLLEQLSNGAQ
jgi:flagellar motor switch protein FliM